MSKLPGKLSNPVKASELLNAQRIVRDRHADNILGVMYYNKYTSEWEVFFVQVRQQAGIPEVFGEVVGMTGFSTQGGNVDRRMKFIRGLMREYAELI